MKEGNFQNHVPEQNTFIGIFFPWFLVLYLGNSSSNTTPFMHHPLSKRIHNILLAICLSLTIYKFSNLPHKEWNAPPFSFFMWCGTTPRGDRVWKGNRQLKLVKV
ncbi:hypothetical protein VP01_800g1 [Puccinia sorghi]|uniref:Uncharacterized protein n=1 Tax=Puccinia sorghi TaxID=27349 RepID=A0A0L6UBB5_9BASI|nr:hypothetical protein VP01_800g1 [Puccinia sorghi]